MEETLRSSLDTIVGYVGLYGLSVLGAIFILVVGWIAASWLSDLADRGLSRAKRMDETLKGFLSSSVKYLVLAFTIIAVLNRFGVETTSFVAVMGAAGLAIGLALQGTLSSVAAGVMLLFFRPFKVGDYIDASGIAGTVKKTTLFITEMATPDNVMMVVPNASLWGVPIHNYSTNPTRRLDLTLRIGYDDDMDKAQAALIALVEADARVLKDPAPMTAITNLGDSAVDVMVRFWCAAGDYWAVKFDLTKAIKTTMDAQGISIPYPQRDVHLHHVNEKGS
ncbi:mechanosensitive ion channel family protein [Rhodospirillum sp. A1_3_36]|uniref:mechanosensitive ion channel family protein n=1 Tax=Rhodospirillum sp. A1_3_36 TaxID=3391666 RepID=UPI0039A69907